MVPVGLLLVLVVVQAALTFHAKSVLTAAAQDYVRAVQTEQPGSGDAAARAALAGSASLFQSAPVVQRQAGSLVGVEIRASVVSVVPGWDPQVVASFSGPVEQFRPPQNRSGGSVANGS